MKGLSVILFLFSIGQNVFAQELSDFLDIANINVVSGYSQTVKTAPAITAVINKSEIINSGANSLGDILETIPGLHISPSSDAIATVSSSRGITSRLLLLYDGIEVPTGGVNSFGNWYNIPVKNIERVEMMRGPNSAIHGADAVLGVVNVVTSSSRNEVGVILGDNNSRGLNFSTSGKYLSFYLNAFKTDGDQPTITFDRQSGLDQLFQSNASLAPGSANDEKQIYESRIHYGWNDSFSITGAYYRQDELGTAAGNFQALDPLGFNEYHSASIDINYKPKVLGWDIDSNLTFHDVEADGDSILLPPDSIGGLFPQGVRQRLNAKEERQKVQVAALKEVGNRHYLRLGVGYIKSDVVNKSDRRNYTFVSGVNAPVPVGSFSEFRNTEGALLSDLDYDLKSAFLHDEWQVTNSMVLSMGVRRDSYSTFGVTNNPKVSVVWNPTSNTTTKLLYGESFRPPSATELTSNGIFVALGSRSLEPSKLKMTEFILDHEFNAALNSTFSVYRYKFIDLIGQAPSNNSLNGLAFLNIDEQQKGKGAEFELVWKPSDNITIKPSWAYTSLDSLFDERNRYIPKNVIKLNGQIYLSNNWSINLFGQHINGRRRGQDDRRNHIDDYTVLNLNIRKEKLLNAIDLNISVNNIFNDDAREPISRAIQNDYPYRKRNFLINLTYQM